MSFAPLPALLCTPVGLRLSAVLGFALAHVLAAPALASAQGRLLFSEIQYHPVEKALFDDQGEPVLDLSEDVHEFVEVHNAGPAAVSLGGWSLGGGIAFDFPAGRSLAPGGFLVIARSPVRLAAVPAYGLAADEVLGPYVGQLSNGGDTLRLRNPAGQVVDSVSYSPRFPWAISADGLGADDEWTGVNSLTYQYRGRSLERVSYASPGNDPANWVASPLPAGPSPGRANALELPLPRPVVLELSAVQAVDSAPIVRSGAPVRVEARFSSTQSLSGVVLEYFVDAINSTTEPRFTVPLAPVVTPSDGRFVATLPAQPDRSVVRYRLRADRGAGLETVSPRADDPFAWHGYFVTPSRLSAKPAYDVFISSASLATLAGNVTQVPRRILQPDPPGTPRAAWNATEPAVFACNGRVYDIQVRYHGSRYSRSPGESSFKFQFPAYAPFNGRQAFFETEKGDEHRLGTLLYAAAGLPAWRCRPVDVYLNGNGALPRLEQEELDRENYERWIEEQAAAHPGEPRQKLGENHKATGVVPYETSAGIGTTALYENSGEGPYYIGNAAPIPPKPGWPLAERYEWTYGAQVTRWRGGASMRDLIQGLWAARGDSPLAPNPNLPALREFLAARFDLDATLTYIAIRNWSAPFDNATHNHFLWERGDGRWGMLPWDLDAEFSPAKAAQSIYWDEYAVAQPDTLRGPEWVKDSFLKAFRDEYREKLFFLNNTLLSPSNLTALGAGGLAGYAAVRQGNVNTELRLGPWTAPLQPVLLAPGSNAPAFPPESLRVGPYQHSASPAVAHLSTTWILRRASGSYSNPVVRITSRTNLLSLPVPFAELVFGESYFWKCQFTDLRGHPSPESPERPFVHGFLPASLGSIRLNEVLAENRLSVTNGNFTPDYIELFNETNVPLSLAQFSLSDDPAQPARFVFPPGSVIPPGGFLTVWCDTATNAPGLHTGFALDNEGQTVALFAISAQGYQLADAVTFGLQIPDHSIGRSGSDWVLGRPTPGASNELVAVAAPTSLRINEWMASSSTGPDWFEIFNSAAQPASLGGLFVGDSPATRTNTRLANLSFIAARGHRRFWADRDPAQGIRHTNFRLSGSGDSILLSAASLALIDTVSFGVQTTDVSQGRLPDGGPALASFPGSASPEAPNHLLIPEIVFNELLPDVELRNLGAVPVPIGGWWLSDDPTVPEKYSIPAGITLAPGAVWFVDDDELPFQLQQQPGGEIFLSHDGIYQVSRKFDAYDGLSRGRVETSIGAEVVRMSAPTFGFPNAPPQVGPVVISEIQYHPPDLPGDDDRYEFVELANIAAGPVPLSLAEHAELPWRLRDAVGFRFPPGTVMAAGEHILVLSFDPATNTAALADFRAFYSVPPGTRLFGPYAGKLDNSGGSIELVEDQLPWSIPGPDYGRTPEVLLERIRFADGFPWPTEADGAGASLQRRLLGAFGNDPTNWFASGVSPGAGSRSNQPPVIALTSPPNGASLSFSVPPTLTATATDPDGSIRVVEFLVDGAPAGASAGPEFTVAWTNAVPGLHLLTARAIDDRLGIAAAAPVQFTVVNQPPSVSLLTPAGGGFYLLPTQIVLTAAAVDPEGVLTKVSFFANNLRLAERAAPPYDFTWTNPPSGAFSLRAVAADNGGRSTTSAAVSIVVSRETSTAYVVETNTVGSQSLPSPFGLGMDFVVTSPILVVHLGCFDSGSDGINRSSALTTQIYNRNGSVPVVAASQGFSAEAPGALAGGSRFKPLPVPVVLTNGSYSVVGYGYDGNNRNANPGTGDAKTWSTEDGGGILLFVGGGTMKRLAQGPSPTPSI